MFFDVDLIELSCEGKTRINKLIMAYKKSERDYLEHSERWSADKWKRSFKGSGLEDFLPASISDLSSVSRRDVQNIFESIRSPNQASNRQVLQAFIAAMIWGYGTTGYGPYRTQRILSSSRDERVKILRDVWDHARSGYSDAYKCLKSKIHGLGPAFGTKFIYFASDPDKRLPILDLRVSEWLIQYVTDEKQKKKLSVYPWSPSVYESYHKFCQEVATDLELKDCGVVEYVMFTDIKAQRHFSLGSSLPEWVHEFYGNHSP